ncbi:MAG TPA: PAS domain S-box protein, partial [Anaerolineaceae bacterium]|nr:PAS domain S-box protein [Anaerolineaceae bacterium]
MIENGFRLLMYNAVILLITALLFDITKIQWRQNLIGFQRIIVGLILGFIGIMLMNNPWNFASEIIFDIPSILLSVSGLFFGVVPTIIAVVMTSVMRYVQGGVAVWTGISMIIATGGIGIAWRYLRKKNIDQISIIELYLFGLVNHVVMLLLMLTLPREIALNVLVTSSLPVLLIYPIATSLLGFVLVNRAQREKIYHNLQVREEQLSLAVQAANIGFFDKNLKNGNTQISPEWKNQLGFDADEIRDDDLEWEIRLHPEDKEKTIREINSVFEGSENFYETTFRLKHKNGSYRWILSRGSIHRDEDGKALQVIGCHVDVTALKEFEQALVTNERRFRGLAESSQDIITLFDKNYRIEFVNRAGLELTGEKMPAIHGKRLEDVFSEKRLIDNLINDLENVILTGKPASRIGIWPIKNAKNEDRNLMMDWRLTPVRNSEGQIEWILGIARDITNLMETEAALKKSEEKFRRIFETSGLGISLTDLDGNFLSGNPAILRMLGYSQKEYVKLNIRDVSFPEDVDEDVKLIEEYKTGIRESFSIEKRMLRKTGEIFWASLISTLVRDEFGKPLFTIGMMEDITSRKIAEEKEMIVQQELQDLLSKADQSRQALLSLIEDQRLAEIELKRLTSDLIIAYDTTLEGWSHALELREQETAGHSRRVVDLTLNVARRFGIKDDDLVQIERGALLHDIGKMGVPDNILLKPGALTEEEWVIMRKHPVYAYNLLSKIEFLKPALDIPYSHHERWDGSGYPQGMVGKEIPLAARIFAVIDIWDALSSDRPYRPAWQRDEILTYIRDISGKQLDPEIVDVFLDIV